MVDLNGKSFTTTDIAERLNIKRERIKNWIKEGYIQPSVKGSGPGTKHLFSLWDLYMLKLFEYLLKRGFSRDEASKMMKLIFEENPYGPNLTEDNELYKNVVCEDNKKPFIVFIKGINQKDTSVFGFDNDQIADLANVEHNQSHLEALEGVYIVNFQHIMNQVDSAMM